MAQCVLFERECIDCGACERCPIYDRICINCFECLDEDISDADYAEVLIDSVENPAHPGQQREAKKEK